MLQITPLRRAAIGTVTALSLLSLGSSFLGASAVQAQTLPQPLPPIEQPQDKPLTPTLIQGDGLTNPVSVTGEIRGMWVVRDSLTSPQKIRNVVALAKKYGFNTLFVQVRGRGDAFYNSRFEPRAEELAGQSLDFDPLATTLEEAHREGLEVHAWMNTFLVWSKGRRPYSSRHVVNQHPEWLVQDKNGRRRTTPTSDCEGGFLDPAITEVQQFTRNVFLDVVERYPIDGIHFDYVRFPSNQYSFSQTSLNAFRAHMALQLSENDRAYADSKAKKNRLAYYYLFRKQWHEWRKELVAETVNAISDAAHKVRPSLIVSAAVFPNYDVASVDKGQGWHEWLQEGYLDAVCPMTYNKSTEVVAAQVRDAVRHSAGRPVIPGVGAYQMPAASAIAKGQVCRQLGASGLNFFSYDGMTRNGRTEAYLAKVSTSLFTTPTLAPNWQRPVQTAQNTVTNGLDGVTENRNENELDLRPGR
ncbi:MAG: hypothetical protein OHK0029_33590 [Armatimonadaceae bacterium]